MNEQQLSAVKQALEALECIPTSGSMLGTYAEQKRIEAITTLQSIISQDALDKKADNARELGLSYDDEPAPYVAEPRVQEPVAWMDGYRNIYSLEEKAAGCPEATIPLVPLANQQQTSGSPIFQRWAVFCGGCRKEWSVPYQHPGKSICAECEAKCKDTSPAPQPVPVKTYHDGKPWPVQPAAHQCHWLQVDDEHTPDTWHGACGAVWTFTEGGPNDNDQAYCPKCGGVCIEVREKNGGAA